MRVCVVQGCNRGRGETRERKFELRWVPHTYTMNAAAMTTRATPLKANKSSFAGAAVKAPRCATPRAAGRKHTVETLAYKVCARPYHSNDTPIAHARTPSLVRNCHRAWAGDPSPANRRSHRDAREATRVCGAGHVGGSTTTRPEGRCTPHIGLTTSVCAVPPEARAPPSNARRAGCVLGRRVNLRLRPIDARAHSAGLVFSSIASTCRRLFPFHTRYWTASHTYQYTYPPRHDSPHDRHDPHRVALLKYTTGDVRRNAAPTTVASCLISHVAFCRWRCWALPVASVSLCQCW
jgi:hypothetical protein